MQWRLFLEEEALERERPERGRRAHKYVPELHGDENGETAGSVSAALEYTHPPAQRGSCDDRARSRTTYLFESVNGTRQRWVCSQFASAGSVRGTRGDGLTACVNRAACVNRNRALCVP